MQNNGTRNSTRNGARNNGTRKGNRRNGNNTNRNSNNGNSNNGNNIPTLTFEEGQDAVSKYLLSDVFKERGEQSNAANTQKSVPTLVKIIERGMITTDSQEGTIASGYDDDTKEYYEAKERAYVTGYMKRKHGLEFIDRINTNTNMVAFRVTRGCGSMKSFSANVASITVTTYRTGSKLPLTDPWKASTSLYTTLPGKSNEFNFDAYFKLPPLDKSEDVIEVMCFDPQYGRQAGGPDGLYQIIQENL